jgi:hypothetical protein
LRLYRASVSPLQGLHQACIRREGTSEAAQKRLDRRFEEVAKAVGGGCQSGWGRHKCHGSWHLPSGRQWLGIGLATWQGGGVHRGPVKETTTRRNVTQGVRPPLPMHPWPPPLPQSGRPVWGRLGVGRAHTLHSTTAVAEQRSAPIRRLADLCTSSQCSPSSDADPQGHRRTMAQRPTARADPIH